MTILRNLGRGLTAATRGAARGLPQGMALRESMLGRKQKALEAEELAKRQTATDLYRETTLDLQRQRMMIAPLQQQANDYQSLVEEAIKLGDDDAYNSARNSQMEVYDQIRGIQSVDTPPSGLPLDVEAAPYETVDVPEDDGAAGLILGKSRERIAAGKFKTMQTYGRPTASVGGPDAAIAYVKSAYPNMTVDEEQRLRDAYEGYVPDTKPKYTHVDPVTGLAFDPVTNKIVSLPVPTIPGSNMTPEQFDRADTLNKRWKSDNSVKMYGAASAGYDGARTGYLADNAPGDIALLYGFAKAVAPDDSAVREGEFATMEEAQGWFSKILNRPLKILEGRRLEPAARKLLWRQLDSIYRARLGRLVDHSKDIARQSKRAGVDPEDTMPSWHRINPGEGSLETMPTVALLSLLQADNKDQEVIAQLRTRLGTMPGEDLVDDIKSIMGGGI